MEKAELSKNSKENIQWLKENYEDLKKKYDEHWTIIENKKVIKSAGTFDEILAIIRNRDPNKVIVEFMQSDQIAMFF